MTHAPAERDPPDRALWGLSFLWHIWPMIFARFIVVESTVSASVTHFMRVK
jgi:hypothetical protein